jgi:hypothetical protein
MHRKIPTGVALAIIFSLALAFLCWVYFGDTVVRQTRQLKLIREYLPGFTNVVYSHPEFHEVKVSAGYGSGGCILVYGFVENRKQVSDLGNIVSAAKPPFPVEYQLQILGEPGVFKP